jgi:hypothetical protein
MVLEMARKQFCAYCGEKLSEGCDCEPELFDIEEYENSPETHAGWHQQDIIDMYRRER